jgi:2-polyprenyl-3-methyl-5-hydroxy-6-metoxy-1,4-benzoquinol methylase
MTDMNNDRNPFLRSGLASLSDLETETHHRLCAALEKTQSEFLSKQESFRSPEYSWPNDALHNWSRIWEYPYVYSHLMRWHHQRSSNPAPVIADVGSGVTFFPFQIARMGCHVICADPDPVCERDMTLATQSVPQHPGQVTFRRIKDATLPFDSQECDAVYCLSVLEHIPQFENTVREIARILKPKGLLLLTIDLDLQGNAEMGVKEHDVLREALAQTFEFLFPDGTIHPADVLDSTKGPYPMFQLSRRDKLMSLVKQEFIKPVFGLRPKSVLPLYLAVQGFALQKR